MFKQQTTIQQAIPAIRAVVARYPSWHAQPTDWLDAAQAQAQQFVVPVPLVGAFSAGKSTLINAVIGSPLLSTNIDPETAVPAEVWHSPTESLTGCLPNGQRMPLTRDAVRDNQVQALLGGGWIEAALPIPLLQDMPHLKLVDMPGWDSGIQAHSTAIDGYATRSLAYGVAVSADEGNLRDSIRSALKELAVRDMPIFVVITKADKKPPEEVQAIQIQVAQEVEKTIGKPPFLVCCASARKKELASFIAALQEIERRTETLFATHAAQPFAQQLTSLSRHLDTLLNSDDLDTEKIADQCAQLKTDMRAFADHLQHETLMLDARMQPVVGRIWRRIENKLLAQSDALTSDALSGRDLNGPIGVTVRLAVEEGVRDEFRPEIERYLGAVAKGLPDTFNLSMTESWDIRPASGSAASSVDVGALLSVVLPFLLKLHPLVAVLGPILIGFIKHYQSEADKAVAEQKRRDSVAQQIRQEVIPKVVQETCKKLEPQLRQYVQEAKEMVAQKIEVQKQSKEAALAELSHQLAQGQAAFAQKCVQYVEDQKLLKQVIAQLQPA